MTMSNSAGNLPPFIEPRFDASVDFASADLSVAIGAASGGYDGLQPDAATIQMLDVAELPTTDGPVNIDGHGVGVGIPAGSDEISVSPVQAIATPDGAPGSGFLGLGDGDNGSNASLQVATAEGLRNSIWTWVYCRCFKPAMTGSGRPILCIKCAGVLCPTAVRFDLNRRHEL